MRLKSKKDDSTSAHASRAKSGEPGQSKTLEATGIIFGEFAFQVTSDGQRRPWRTLCYQYVDGASHFVEHLTKPKDGFPAIEEILIEGADREFRRGLEQG